MSRQRRVLWQLRRLAILYAVVVLVVTVFQRHALYFPQKISSQSAAELAAAGGFEAWQNGSGQTIGWKLPAVGRSRGSVLIVHGNAGCALDRVYLAQPIHSAATVDVYVLEYPGYGVRGGSPSRASIVAAGNEAFELLPRGLPRYVVSESIGAGVACEIAKAHPGDVAGMALVAPFDNLASVAQRRLPWLPTYLLLFDRFKPAQCLESYHGPIKFVIAGADEIIPPASGRRLADGYAGPKKIEVIPGAGHNDVAGQSSEWWGDVFEFWGKRGGAGKAASQPF
ncbi:MAG: alpha/beta hydrolase [Phycisphaerae bacterium]|nr:alpha/beta hydrolase [Phycisphaerae bacterium]